MICNLKGQMQAPKGASKIHKRSKHPQKNLKILAKFYYNTCSKVFCKINQFIMHNGKRNATHRNYQKAK